MPFLSISGEEAYDNVARNPEHRWAERERERNAADERLASQRTYRGFLDVGLRPPFRADVSRGVFTLGSCFAREIEDALEAKGVRVLTRDPVFRDASRFPRVATHLRPTAFLNRYHTASMLGEIRHILGVDRRVQEGALLYVRTPPDRLLDLHYSPALVMADRETCLWRRRRILEAMESLRTAQTLVLTLGLVEAWRDEEDGLYLNTVPSRYVLDRNPGRFTLHVLDFHDNLANLEAIRTLVRQHCQDDLRFIVTVSPVPLEVTFTRDDVVVANSRSKTVLRAAAEEFSARHDDVAYFPSFEYVTHSERELAWGWDGRHVQRPMVAFIMDHFLEHYVRPTAS